MTTDVWLIIDTALLVIILLVLVLRR